MWSGRLPPDAEPILHTIAIFNEMANEDPHLFVRRNREGKWEVRIFLLTRLTRQEPTPQQTNSKSLCGSRKCIQDFIQVRHQGRKAVDGHLCRPWLWQKPIY